MFKDSRKVFEMDEKSFHMVNIMSKICYKKVTRNFIGNFFDIN